MKDFPIETSIASHVHLVLSPNLLGWSHGYPGPMVIRDDLDIKWAVKHSLLAAIHLRDLETT